MIAVRVAGWVFGVGYSMTHPHGNRELRVLGSKVEAEELIFE